MYQFFGGSGGFCFSLQLKLQTRLGCTYTVILVWIRNKLPPYSHLPHVGLHHRMMSVCKLDSTWMKLKRQVHCKAAPVALQTLIALIWSMGPGQRESAVRHLKHVCRGDDILSTSHSMDSHLLHCSVCCCRRSLWQVVKTRTDDMDVLCFFSQNITADLEEIACWVKSSSYE